MRNRNAIDSNLIARHVPNKTNGRRLVSYSRHAPSRSHPGDRRRHCESKIRPKYIGAGINAETKAGQSQALRNSSHPLNWHRASLHR